MGDQDSLTLVEVQHDIAIRHLHQLSQMPTITIPGDDGSEQLPIGSMESEFESLKRWSHENKDIIRYAIEQRAHGKPGSIDWKCAFLAFMESCAMYFRDSKAVEDAVLLYQKNEYEDAIAALDRAVAKIQELASIWGMKFQLLSDLIDERSSDPESKSLSGPYCGAFYSEDPDTSFVGIAFKGTNILNPREVMVNVKFETLQSPHDKLYGTHVTKGVYNGLFGNFGDGKSFELISEGLRDLLQNLSKGANNPVVVHITGHSLGGSYSSACYTQYTIKDQFPSSAILGDLYTFGSPRVGEEDFATALRKHCPETGSSWRIVNEGDSITTAPPYEICGIRIGEHVHVDTAYQISPHDAPKLMSSEIGTQPPPGYFLVGIPQHTTKSYYESLKKVLSG